MRADGTLPTGTLTLLFTDIEGATLLLAELATRYSEVLSLQRRILRKAFDRWGGHEVESEGGSFFVVFSSADAALDAAADAQRGIAEAAWPTEGVRIRMGLHTGEPVRHEEGYVGTDVRRAARVASVAHGGQILLTAATHRLPGGRPEQEFVSLGRHRLKDVPGAEELLQLVAPGLDRDFPPPRSVGSVAMLPEPATSLVGRETELDDVVEAVRESPVVTLVGAPGVGKTRLGLAAATSLSGDFPDGVYFVHLAAARTIDMVRNSVADAVAASGEDRTPAGLVQFFSTMRALIVLDAVAEIPGIEKVIAELATAGPGVRVLVTSRAPVGLSAEHVRILEPLEVPLPGADAEVVTASGAVQLLVQTARQTMPELHLDDAAMEQLGEIARVLGGLPLAIELVGARTGPVRPVDLRAKLEAALGAEPDPEAILPTAVELSYELLGEDVRRSFRLLSVFDGWFDLPAAVAVVEHAEDGLQVLEHLGELLQANFLTVRDGPDGEPGIRMLRPLVDHGRGMLAGHGEEATARRRHAEHYLDLAEEVTEQLGSTSGIFARDRLEVALDNIRAALAWAFGTERAQPGDVALGLRLCAALSRFWFSVGYPTEGRHWLEIGLERASGSDSPDVMRAMHSLGVILHQHGETGRAATILERCLDYWQRAGDQRGTALALNTLALSRRALGRPQDAARLLSEAVGHARELGDRSVLADILSNLAALEIDGERYEAAIARLQEVLAIDTAIDDRWGIAADHVNLASTLLRAGRDDEAAQMLDEHAAGAVALGDIELTADLVEIYCALHASRGDVQRAATLLGVAQGLRERAELPMSEPDRRWLEQRLAAAQRSVDSRTWEGWVRAGRRLTPEEALVEAQRRP